MTISEQLREAIRRCGETHYRVGKESGVDTAVIDRFVSGERPNVMAPTIDRLCDYLGLELCEKNRAASTRKTAATAAKRAAKKQATGGKSAAVGAKRGRGKAPKRRA